ncbi:MAG: GrpB family protein [Dehalogenimonas sp.]
MNIRQSRKVKVVSYDPTWPTVFNSEAEAVRVALGSLVTEIHHIGSTSIPSAAAKPIIDMMPVVTNIDLVDAANDPLATIGYSGRGEYGIPGRRFFVKETPGERSHHLHVFQYGNPEIARHLAFRDYMMAHPDELEAYCILKSALAKQYPGDIESYIAGKDAFIKDIDRKAAGV